MFITHIVCFRVLRRRRTIEQYRSQHTTKETNHSRRVHQENTRRERLHTKAVVEHARAGGDRISLGYLSGIESGAVVNPTSAKLKALACGLGVSEKEMFEVMHGVALDDSEEFQKSELARCYEKIKQLTGENRMKADVAVEALGVYIDKLLQMQRRAANLQNRVRRE